MNSYVTARSADARIVDLSTYRATSTTHSTCDLPATDERWPAWKSSLFIIFTCSSFWLTVALALRAVF